MMPSAIGLGVGDQALLGQVHLLGKHLVQGVTIQVSTIATRSCILHLSMQITSDSPLEMPGVFQAVDRLLTYVPQGGDVRVAEE